MAYQAATDSLFVTAEFTLNFPGSDGAAVKMETADTTWSFF